MSTDNDQYIVTINHNGVQRHQSVVLDQNTSLTVGRSWKSDVAINDEYIDAEHLVFRVDQSGELVVEDSSSKNGTRAGKQPIKGAVHYQQGTALSIGDSSLSVIDANAQVAPALKRDTVQKLSRKSKSLVWLTLSTLAAIAALVALSVLVNTDELTSENIAATAAAALVSFITASFAGGLLSKLFRHKPLFGLHYMFICWMLFLFAVLTVLWNITAFNIHNAFASTVLNNVVFGGFTLFVFYGFFSMTTRFSRKVKLSVAALAVMVPTVFGIVTPMLESEHDAWRGHVSIDSVTQPPQFQFRAASNVNAHFNKTDNMFERLTAEVQWPTDASPVPTSPNDGVAVDSIKISEIE